MAIRQIIAERAVNQLTAISVPPRLVVVGPRLVALHSTMLYVRLDNAAPLQDTVELPRITVLIPTVNTCMVLVIPTKHLQGPRL